MKKGERSQSNKKGKSEKNRSKTRKRKNEKQRRHFITNALQQADADKYGITSEAIRNISSEGEVVLLELCNERAEKAWTPADHFDSHAFTAELDCHQSLRGGRRLNK